MQGRFVASYGVGTLQAWRDLKLRVPSRFAAVGATPTTCWRSTPKPGKPQTCMRCESRPASQVAVHVKVVDSPPGTRGTNLERLGRNRVHGRPSRNIDARAICMNPSVGSGASICDVNPLHTLCHVDIEASSALSISVSHAASAASACSFHPARRRRFLTFLSTSRFLPRFPLCASHIVTLSLRITRA